jgi:hypothetical protein
MRADADGIIRSEPVETPTNGTEMRCSAPVETRSVAVAEEDEWAGWNNWARGHVNILRQEMLDSVSEAFALVRAEWEDAFDAEPLWSSRTLCRSRATWGEMHRYSVAFRAAASRCSNKARCLLVGILATEKYLFPS